MGDEIEKYNIVLIDNNGSQYGIVSVYSGWTRRYVYNLVEELLRKNCNNDEKVFLDRFSEVVSDMLEDLETMVVKAFKNGKVEFQFENCDTFNVDDMEF